MIQYGVTHPRYASPNQLGCKYKQGHLTIAENCIPRYTVISWSYLLSIWSKIRNYFIVISGYELVRRFRTFSFCQIWLSYWSRSTGRSTVLVEVRFGQKGQSKVGGMYQKFSVWALKFRLLPIMKFFPP